MDTQKNITCLAKVLEKPHYPFELNGKLYVPTHREILSEFFSRMTVLKDLKKWMPAFSWFAACLLAVFFFGFLKFYFSWKLFLIGMVYSMVWMGTHGTIYLHRYSTHRAYKFRNSFARFIVRNLSIKVIPEEIYVVSHHVHHQMSEKPGDPYNVNGGWLYCFLADATHQPINRSLNESEYSRLTKLMNHTGVKINTFTQYLRYGSLAHPVRTVIHYLLNWSFWFATFFLIGGMPLAMAIFGCAAIWAFGVRTYNYDGHGGGKDKRQDGIDFNRRDMSINQVWPGYVAGEWHNNHHLYPNGARSGFLPYQFDTAWVFIWLYKQIGGISSYRDYKQDFLNKYYLPYLNGKQLSELNEISIDVDPELAEV